ncbi:MAG: N-acetylglucosamine-6-phosphate deacetylase [Clostridia bacterium]|nr:N-acetylglucosamine-6-phosphate deacetylase [Clostridia bacterium]
MFVPAFVDIHMHGAAGHDVGTTDREGLHAICAMLAAHGTAGFLPTLPAVSFENCRRALNVISEVMEEQSCFVRNMVKTAEPGVPYKLPEALILGAHLEGPFMLSTCKGALDESVFVDATVENWEKLTGDLAGIVKRVTIDPLRPGAMELIPYLAAHGVSVTCGHTAADADTVNKAFRAGATSVTHIFNAMPSLHHRAPGPVGAALADDDTYAELISDFLHVNSLVCKMVIKCKTPDHVAVITDSCEAAGMPDGRYQLSGREIMVVNGEARLEDGRLASSTVFMDRERLNLLSLGFGERDIAKLTHHTPLSAIGAKAGVKHMFSSLFAGIGPDGYAEGTYYIKN